MSKLLLILCLSIALLCTHSSAYTIMDDAWIIHDIDIEHAFVYHNNITIYHTIGTDNSFWIPDTRILNGSVLLHNHVKGYEEGFSYKDMRLAHNSGVSRMVLSTNRGIWVADKPFTQWNFSAWESIYSTK